MFPLILSQKPYLIQRGHEHSSPYKRGGMKRKSAGYSELLPNEKSWGVGQRSVVCDAVANERGGNSTRRGLVTCGSLLQLALWLIRICVANLNKCLIKHLQKFKLYFRQKVLLYTCDNRMSLQFLFAKVCSNNWNKNRFTV